MIKGKAYRMSDRRNGGEDESSRGELDELIPRNRGPSDHEEEEEEEDGIQCEKTKLLLEISENQRKESDEEKQKQVSFHGNQKKVRSKVKRILLTPFRQFNKHREGKKKKAADRRCCKAPFPYDGEDFGGRPPSCYPRVPSLPHKTRTDTTMAKPETSSYYYFSKSFIEKNDFYSPDCNVHRDIPRSHRN
ncbi:hypothetical protein KFK09_023525 [Dendrobium nobile]|uniref:Uncharacterized protein n=1 Tax=Dendrobium nobile TaxID=94219 RepID=A0A8T3ABA3_DENNO|nr:hypothetical protein KFK09_023525 [Dendrobium nobile]